MIGRHKLMAYLTKIVNIDTKHVVCVIVCVVVCVIVCVLIVRIVVVFFVAGRFGHNGREIFD